MKNLGMRYGVLVSLLLFSGSLWASEPVSELAGIWQLESASYNNEIIADLTGSIAILGATYQAEFTNGVDSGRVEGTFELVDNLFNSNADDGYVKLDRSDFGFDCCPYRTTWKTNIHCRDAVYQQWGATALGFLEPMVDFSGDYLRVANVDENGETVLNYRRLSDVLSPSDYLTSLAINTTYDYGDMNDSLRYHFDVDVDTSRDVTSMTMVTPTGRSWVMNREIRGEETSFTYRFEAGTLTGLLDFGPGIYTFDMTARDGRSGHTTAAYQMPNGDPVGAVTQEPRLLHPTPGATGVAPSVTFAFEGPADPNWTTNLTWVNVSTGALGGVERLPSSVTTHGPVSLDSGTLYRLVMEISHTIYRNNVDGIPCAAGMMSGAVFSFETQKLVVIPDPALLAGIQAALGVTDVFAEDLQGLTRLELPHAGIQDLTGLEGATSLTSLNLTGNPITDINGLSGLIQLQELELTDNVIENVDALSGLTALVELSLKGNKIKSVGSLQGLHGLKRLQLGGNRIVDVTALQGLTELEVLWLNNNQIAHIHPLVELHQLMYLDLRGNPLEPGACADLALLELIIKDRDLLRADIASCP